MAKVLEFQLYHHFFQRNPRADLLQNGLVGSPCSPRDSQESSPTPREYYQAVNIVTSNVHIIENSYLPEMRSVKSAELTALIQACQLAKDQIATIYTDNSYTFGVARDFGILWQQ